MPRNTRRKPDTLPSDEHANAPFWLVDWTRDDGTTKATRVQSPTETGAFLHLHDERDVDTVHVINRDFSGAR